MTGHCHVNFGGLTRRREREYPRGSRNVLDARLPPLGPESLQTNLVISAGGDQVAAWMEVTVDKCVSRKEILCLPG
jgi:hypothetical protein